MEIVGLIYEMSVGFCFLIDNGEDNLKVFVEVVGFCEGYVLCMFFFGLEGVCMGCKVVISVWDSVVYLSNVWFG